MESRTKQSELLELAIIKAKTLPKNTKIRLTAEVNSYWVFNLNGDYYIGYNYDEPIGNFFKGRPSYRHCESTGDGKTVKGIAEVQRLIEAHK